MRDVWEERPDYAAHRKTALFLRLSTSTRRSGVVSKSFMICLEVQCPGRSARSLCRVVRGSFSSDRFLGAPSPHLA